MKVSWLWPVTLLAICTLSAGANPTHEGLRDPRQQTEQRLHEVSRDAEMLFPSSDSKKPDGKETWQVASIQNGIDEITFQKMKEDGIPINELCDDGTFIRRLSLLLTGRLPDPTRTRSFLGDPSPDKRSQLIDEMLASAEFRTYWSFWFQEYFQSTGFLLRQGLNVYNQYFATAVATAKPLTQLAREMITSSGLTDEVGPANFIARSREGARYPLDFWDNLAVHTSSKFLGIQLECVSCHDGAFHLENINLYLAERKREEFWGMAAFFAGTSIRAGNVNENQLLSFNVTSRPSPGYNAVSEDGDRPIRDGGLIMPRYFFTGEQPVMTDQDTRVLLADRITSDRQFARNFANRFWGHLFGLAMVEPMDGFDPYRLDPNKALPQGWESQTLNLELLEYMTDKMIALDFQFPEYLRFILNSATFQMSSSFKAGNWQERYAPYYTRFLARRLPAETVFDSVLVATGTKAQIRTRSNSGTLVTLDYAHQLPDLAQPRGDAYADQAAFLNAFGRGNRYDLPRTNTGSINQALLLMNSSFINGRLLAPNNRLVNYINSDLPGEAIIAELYLDVFCHYPSENGIFEMLTALATIETPVDRASTALWLLLNKAEFSFVY